ncbi:MAG: beta-ketoacyl synthase N-terminal-like domain-containing protein [Spongiibacteraceae bacterium]
MKGVQLLGMGLHTALGFGEEEHFAALQQPPRLPTKLQVHFGPNHSTVPCHTLAHFPFDENNLQIHERRLYDVVQHTIDHALMRSALSAQQIQRTAVFVGSSSFDISVSESHYRRHLLTNAHALPLAFSNSIGNLAFFIAERFGMRGPDYSFNTACTASANALLYAAQMIATGQIEHAIVVGIELANAITLLGFQSLGLLTDTLMRPFDSGRSGLAIGESCAAVVLGRSGSASQLRLLGGANRCDTHGISAANPDGTSVHAVMQQALNSTQLTTDDISAIKTHGTASLLNDEAEAAGLQRTFAQMPLLCALKPYIGHTLGACGLSELVLLYSALQRGVFPAVPGVCAQPSELGIRFPQTLTPIAEGNFMLNYFGFGGSNTALIVSNREH